MVVVHYSRFGGTVRELAELYSVSKSSVAKWAKVGPKVTTRSVRIRACKFPCMPGLVAELVGKHPFATVRRVKWELEATHSVKASMATVHRVMKKLGFRYKVASRSRQHQSPDAAHPFMLDPSPYTGAISVDEASFVSIDAPRRGWGVRGQAVPKRMPKKRTRVSLLLAIDAHGVVDYEILKGAAQNNDASSVPCA
jgi:transposase